MKKVLVLSLSAAVVLSSCSTYAGSGAITGGSLGSILGSAIGGIAGGARGSDIGSIVGMAGGAIIGASTGAKADRRAKEDVHDHYEKVQQRKAREKRNRTEYDYYNQTDDYGRSGSVDGSGFDNTNSDDDRIYDFQSSDYTGSYSAAQPNTKAPAESSVDKLAGNYQYTPRIEIVNARFVDDNQDGVLSRNEVGKIIFEVMNRGNKAISDVQPSVLETTGNAHIYVSPSIHIESIAPGKGVRYTALVKADKKLKNGMARFALTVLQGQKSISKVTEFNIKTSK
jgi:putative lipoprotein